MSVARLCACMFVGSFSINKAVKARLRLDASKLGANMHTVELSSLVVVVHLVMTQSEVV